MSTLPGIIAEALSQARAQTGPLLLPRLQAAELELKEFSKGLPLLPDYDVNSVRDTISSKRAELWSEAIAAHEAESASIIATKLGEALYSYLSSNNLCQFVGGSLVAPPGGGPVTPSAVPAVAIINYS